MRKTFGVLSVLAACLAVPAGAGAAAAQTRPPAVGTWGNAKEVPGIAALNVDGGANAPALSCASAGNCAVGGSYTDGSGHEQSYVADETKGTWGSAQEVPGTAALNLDYSSLVSVSCPSAGNCGGSGSYQDSTGQQAYVVSETNGTWGSAQEIPGSAALNLGGNASAYSISCVSAGNCAASGTYTDESGGLQGFVVSEKRGVWAAAEEVPGLGALNQGGLANLSHLTCVSAGNCAVGGSYTNASFQSEAFVVTEKNGTWGNAKEVRGSGALNRGGYAQVASVSCASAGNCGAVGAYLDGSQHTQAFTVDETNGTWGSAQQVPGLAALNTGGNAMANYVSCGSAGNCTAIGTYTNSAQLSPLFGVDETNGTWGSAAEIPGTGALNTGDASVFGLSCPSTGNCAAVGWYDISDSYQAFVVGQASGAWGDAEPVPGLGRLATGGESYGEAVSCASVGHCTASGNYSGANASEPFVVSER